MNPYDKAHELAHALKSSDAFTTLQAVRARVEKDASTLRMLQDFRQKQWEFEARQMMGQTLSQREEEELQKLADVVRLNQDVTTYLQAEYQLSVILSDVQRIIGEAVQEAMLPLPQDLHGMEE